jgi:hypothetical protein
VIDERKNKEVRRNERREHRERSETRRGKSSVEDEEGGRLGEGKAVKRRREGD